MIKMKVEELKGRLKEVLEMHLDEFAYRLEEIGGFGVGGVELDVTVPYPHAARSTSERKQQALALAVRMLWERATMTYVFGEFRGAIFLLASIVEAVLRLEVSRRGLEGSLEDYCAKKKSKFPILGALQKSKRKPTLGPLIRFCEKTGILSKQASKLARKVNRLRIEHIHLIIETEMPEEASQITSRDEFVPLSQFKGKPPVEIKEGWISGDGVAFVMDFKKGQTGILYKYKADAKKCLNSTKQFLKLMYPGKKK